jgi:hypothetical protein
MKFAPLACACLLGALAVGCQKKDAPRREPSTGLTAAGSVSAAATAGEATVFTKEILAPVYHVDRIYKSMTGPQSTSEFYLADEKAPELLWIVGFEATMVEKDGKTDASQEWMCHSNLDIDAVEHNKAFGGSKRISGRLFTLSQGQYRIDMPKGFGIPILSSELMSLNTQVLNLNMEKGEKDVRHRVYVRFVRDVELKAPYRALFPAAAYGLKLLRGKDGVFGGKEAPGGDMGAGEHHHHEGHDMSGMAASDDMGGHASCLPGMNASTNEFADGKGRAFTGHWIVKPGREENHTRVTDIMDLPFDTTLHYVAVHLHPFAQSLELIDKTDGKTVYKAFTKQADKGVGLARVDFYESSDGIPLHKGHEYELVSIYQNTTDKDQDSMAVMNLYLHDKEFVKPDLAKIKAQLEKKAAEGKDAKDKGKAEPGADKPSGKLM